MINNPKVKSVTIEKLNEICTMIEEAIPKEEPGKSDPYWEGAQDILNWIVSQIEGVEE